MEGRACSGPASERATEPKGTRPNRCWGRHDSMLSSHAPLKTCICMFSSHEEIDMCAICMDTYIQWAHIHLYTYTSMCIHTHTYIFIYACIHIDTYIYMYDYTNTFVYTPLLRLASQMCQVPWPGTWQHLVLKGLPNPLHTQVKRIHQHA